MRPERDGVGGGLPSRQAALRSEATGEGGQPRCTDTPHATWSADANADANAHAPEGGADLGGTERDPGREISWEESVEALARRCLAEGLVDTGTDAFRRHALHVLRTLRPEAGGTALSEAMLQLRLKLVRGSGGTRPAREGNRAGPGGSSKDVRSARKAQS